MGRPAASSLDGASLLVVAGQALRWAATRGRIKASAELVQLEREYGEFRVYVVEMCQCCAWNHLAVSYVLSHGEQSPER